jgi:hypothetical protein
MTQEQWVAISLLTGFAIGALLVSAFHVVSRTAPPASSLSLKLSPPKALMFFWFMTGVLVGQLLLMAFPIAPIEPPAFGASNEAFAPVLR